MKIGELFIALGFKVEGREDFESAQRGLKSATADAAKLAIGVNAVNAALLAMVDTAMRGAAALQLFGRATGTDTSELQRWEQAGRVAGGAAGAIRHAAEALADARASFALGEPQSVGAWQILGVDPRQDPFAVLAALRARQREFADQNLFRSLLGRVGLEGAYPALQTSDADFAKLRRAFVVDPQQIDRLSRLNREWERFAVGAEAVKNELAASLAPALAAAARGLEWLAARAAAVANWLNSAGTAARAARFVLSALALASLAVGAALAVLTAVLGALVGVSLLASPALLAILAALAPLALAVAAVAGGLVALVLLIDDFWTAAAGGKSLLNWNEGLLLTVKNVDRLAHALEFLIEKAGQLRDLAGFLTPGGGAAFTGAMAERFVAASARPAGGAGFTQNNSVEVRVDGARAPEATGRAVAREVGDEIRAAARQAPVPNW